MKQPLPAFPSHGLAIVPSWPGLALMPLLAVMLPGSPPFSVRVLDSQDLNFGLGLLDPYMQHTPHPLPWGQKKIQTQAQALVT